MAGNETPRVTATSTIDAAQLEAFAEEAAQEGCPFLVSVVMAAYNAEGFIVEAIESVIGQSIGFEHTQLIVVDDGSTDGTFQICRDYESRHPENILVISQENSGAAAARNAGLGHASGKYVNFLDSDDKWSEDAFESALVFFRGHPDVKLAATRYVMFGAKEGDHRLNYKFKKTRVIDLLQEHDCPQLSASSCFFAADVLRDRRFDVRLKVSEDALLVNEILLEELRYGVMSEPVYYYRQREQKGSAIDSMHDSVSWHLETPRLCGQRLMDLSRERYDEVLPFIQFTVMYDLQWHIRAKRPTCLDDEQLKEYRDLLVHLLNQIDDSVISEQRSLSLNYVAYALCLKYGVTMDDMVSDVSIEDDVLFAHPPAASGERMRIALRPMKSLSNRLRIERVDFDGNAMIICGYVAALRFTPENLRIDVRANNISIAGETYPGNAQKLQNPFSDIVVRRAEFICAANVLPGEEVRLKASMRLSGECVRDMRLCFAKTVELPLEEREDACFSGNGWSLRLGLADAIVVRHSDEPAHMDG